MLKLKCNFSFDSPHLLRSCRMFSLYYEQIILVAEKLILDPSENEKRKIV